MNNSVSRQDLLSDPHTKSLLSQASIQRQAKSVHRSFCFRGPPNLSSPIFSDLTNLPELDVSDKKEAYQLYHLQGETIVERDIQRDYVDVRKIENCSLLLDCSLKKLPCQIIDVRSSVVNISDAWSVFVENIKDLIVILLSHQLRVKSTTNCLFLATFDSLQVITEDCTNIYFGTWTGNSVKEPTYQINDLSWPQKLDRNPLVHKINLRFDSIHSLVDFMSSNTPSLLALRTLLIPLILQN